MGWSYPLLCLALALCGTGLPKLARGSPRSLLSWAGAGAGLASLPFRAAALKPLRLQAALAGLQAGLRKFQLLASSMFPSGRGAGHVWWQKTPKPTGQNRFSTTASYLKSLGVTLACSRAWHGTLNLLQGTPGCCGNLARDHCSRT